MLNEDLKLTKELCEKSWCDLSMCVGNTTQTKIFKQLIQEHFEPQPYKFEDLKVGMWVFDNKICDCIKIELILKDKKILCCDGFHRKFEENRFFPVTKALEYQK